MSIAEFVNNSNLWTIQRNFFKFTKFTPTKTN